MITKFKIFENNIELKPSDFAGKIPFDSIFRDANYEFVADDIMIVLYRTGNVFRPLSWEEFKIERLKDGNYVDNEKKYFDAVINWCTTPEKAKEFSSAWRKIKPAAEEEADKYNL